MQGFRERHTYTYIHTYIHACMHTYIHKCKNTHMLIMLRTTSAFHRLICVLMGTKRLNIRLDGLELRSVWKSPVANSGLPPVCQAGAKGDPHLNQTLAAAMTRGRARLRTPTTCHLDCSSRGTTSCIGSWVVDASILPGKKLPPRQSSGSHDKGVDLQFGTFAVSIA